MIETRVEGDDDENPSGMIAEQRLAIHDGPHGCD